MCSRCQDCNNGLLNRTASIAKLAITESRRSARRGDVLPALSRDAWAIVGVSRDAEATMKIITVPVGAVLTIATITLESGLVDATWDGQTVSVFVQDLNTRSDLIRTTGT